MTDEDKDFERKKEKLRLVTLSFYGPEELEEFKRSEEKKKLAAEIAATTSPSVIE